MLKIFTTINALVHNVSDNEQLTPPILTTEETIDLILQKNMSIARYGDGEFNMMLGRNKSINFQVADSSLSTRLNSVFLTSHPNVLICIPKVFNWKDRLLMNPQARKFWSHYIRRQSPEFFNLLHKRTYYGNAFISRPYMDFLKIEYNYKTSDKYFSKIKTLWNKKQVLIVEGELTRFGVGNSLLNNATHIKRILCPAENSWSCVTEILHAILAVSKNFDLVILALGPTATVLAHDLSEHGIQALDLGHLDIEYEWFLQKSSNKTAVFGKYVNEAKENSIPTKAREDSLFHSQILLRVQKQKA